MHASCGHKLRSMPAPVAFPPRRLQFALNVLASRVPRAVREQGKVRVVRAVGASKRHGNTVTCPVCDNTAAAFVKRMCVHCGSGPRPRLLALFLEREMRPKGRILHFAPELALADRLSSMSDVDYVPADLHPIPGWEQVDAMDIRLAPEFDGIITSHVLEHIPDDAAAMREMYRVLKPGGWALVMVPVHLEMQATYEDRSVASRSARHHHYGQYDHARLYGRDVSSRLGAAGFAVTDRHYFEELAPAERERYGLYPRDLIQVCSKEP